MDKEIRDKIIKDFHTRTSNKFKLYAGALGKGTEGEVYKICLTDDNETECAAVKFQCWEKDSITVGKSKESFLKQVNSQLNCNGFAPRVYDVFIADYGKKECGVIVMEKIETSLGKYLETQRTQGELEKVICDVVHCLRQLKSRQMMHGDLTYFNIGLNAKTKHWNFFDFGRASYVGKAKIYYPIEAYRLHTDLGNEGTCTENLKVHKMNQRYILLNIHRWYNALGLIKPEKSLEEIDDAWTILYKKYAKAKKVPGLEFDDSDDDSKQSNGQSNRRETRSRAKNNTSNNSSDQSNRRETRIRAKNNSNNALSKKKASSKQNNDTTLRRSARSTNKPNRLI